jgi:hypothetical protein
VANIDDELIDETICFLAEFAEKFNHVNFLNPYTTEALSIIEKYEKRLNESICSHNG